MDSQPKNNQRPVIWLNNNTEAKYRKLADELEAQKIPLLLSFEPGVKIIKQLKLENDPK